MRADGRLRAVARRLERPEAFQRCDECNVACPLVLVSRECGVDWPASCPGCGRPCYVDFLPLVICERPDGPA